MPVHTPSDDTLRALLEAALAVASENQNGFSGNCAEVAVALNEAIGGDSQYAVVVGEHYEYADHVFLRWKDRLWDMDGAHTEEEAELAWCEDEETLEDFDGDDVVRMADNNGIFAGGFDRERFKQALVGELQKRGFPLPEATEPELPKKAPRPR
mgnify:CR=1 FL=1